MAEAAIKDGLRHKDVAETASLGSKGPPEATPEKDCQWIPGRFQPRTRKIWRLARQRQSFTCSYPQLMDACFGVSKAKEFWDQIKADDPRLIDSPVAWEKDNQPQEWKNQKEKTIPLWLHGGVDFSTDSLLIFSFGGCLTTLIDMQHRQTGLEQSQKKCLEKAKAAKKEAWEQGQETKGGGLKQRKPCD